MNGIVTKDNPYETQFGLITYDMLKKTNPNASGIYKITGYSTHDGFENFDPPILLRLVNVDDYDHGNGD